MSSDGTRPRPAAIVGELARTLRDLRRELRTASGRQGRGLDRLVRLTSEVTIPATILVLETNIRALRLLQRTLRIARDADTETPSGEVATMGRTVVDRIDDALGEAQTAVDNAAVDDEAGDLVAEARELNRQLEARLDAETMDSDDEPASPSVDVESELESLKDEYDDQDADEDGRSDGE